MTGSMFYTITSFVFLVVFLKDSTLIYSISQSNLNAVLLKSHVKNNNALSCENITLTDNSVRCSNFYSLSNLSDALSCNFTNKILANHSFRPINNSICAVDYACSADSNCSACSLSELTSLCKTFCGSPVINTTLVSTNSNMSSDRCITIQTFCLYCHYIKLNLTKSTTVHNSTSSISVNSSPKYFARNVSSEETFESEPINDLTDYKFKVSVKDDQSVQNCSLFSGEMVIQSGEWFTIYSKFDMPRHCQCGKDTRIRCTDSDFVSPPHFCVHRGTNYWPHQNFISDDGCNTCRCSGHDLSVHCTRAQCAGDTDCSWHGRVFKYQQEITDPSGLYSCFCSVNNTVVCRSDLHAQTTISSDISQTDDNSNQNNFILSNNTFDHNLEPPDSEMININSEKTKSDSAPAENAAGPSGVTQFCIYNNDQYKIGTTFSSDDGCNSCTCWYDRQVSCSKVDCRSHLCVYDRRIYLPLQQFAAADGCSTCLCLRKRNGALQVVCSPKVGCQSFGHTPPEGTTPPRGCLVNGRFYNASEQVPSADKCNKCICVPESGVICSLKTCPPTDGNPGDSRHTALLAVFAILMMSLVLVTGVALVQCARKHRFSVVMRNRRHLGVVMSLKPYKNI